MEPPGYRVAMIFEPLVVVGDVERGEHGDARLGRRPGAFLHLLHLFVHVARHIADVALVLIGAERETLAHDLDFDGLFHAAAFLPRRYPARPDDRVFFPAARESRCARARTAGFAPAAGATRSLSAVISSRPALFPALFFRAFRAADCSSPPALPDYSIPSCNQSIRG